MVNIGRLLYLCLHASDSFHQIHFLDSDAKLELGLARWPAITSKRSQSELFFYFHNLN